MTAENSPAPVHSPRERPRLPPVLAWSWAGAWRFGLAGPPIGTALFTLPALLLSSAGASIAQGEVIGGWLLFSLFAYLFAGPSAVLAGAFFGWIKHRSGHRSRWGLGALAGTLGWLVQIGATAVWQRDPQPLNAIAFLPIALIAGAVCARLFDLDPAPRQAATS